MRPGSHIAGQCFKLLLAVVLSAVGLSCGSPSGKSKPKTISEMVFKAQKDAFVDKYSKIPRDEIIQQATSARLYSEMKDYYKRALIELKVAADKDCARLVLVVLSIEVGKEASPANTYGIPYIMVTADNLGIDAYDIADSMAQSDLAQVTVTGTEGAWSKQGAAYIAGQLDAIIRRYDTVRSSKHMSQTNKPKTFGDLEPNQDEVIYDYADQGYHLKVNSQGLRMDHDLNFPKTKQTILILGDGEVYNPMLDNEFIATTLLQKRHPDKEIVNAGVPNYSIDDFESLYKDKARYTEPDLVIVVTNGADILEQYFTYRNKYSRLNRIYQPTDAELQFYNFLYGKK